MASRGALQGDTLYSADAGAGFVEPTVVVSDTIDSYTLAATKAYRICSTPPASAFGADAGSLDASQLTCRSTVVYYIDATEPNQAGEAYVITYGATNSRGM